MDHCKSCGKKFRYKRVLSEFRKGQLPLDNYVVMDITWKNNPFLYLIYVLCGIFPFGWAVFRTKYNNLCDSCDTVHVITSLSTVLASLYMTIGIVVCFVLTVCLEQLFGELNLILAIIIGVIICLSLYAVWVILTPFILRFEEYKNA